MDSDAGVKLFHLARELNEGGHYKYNAGKNDLLDDIAGAEQPGTGLPSEKVEFLRAVERQPTAMHCGESDDDRPVLVDGVLCQCCIPPIRWEINSSARNS